MTQKKISCLQVLITGDELLLLRTGITDTSLPKSTVLLLYVHALALQHVLLHAATQAQMIT